VARKPRTRGGRRGEPPPPRPVPVAAELSSLLGWGLETCVKKTPTRPYSFFFFFWESDGPVLGPLLKGKV